MEVAALIIAIGSLGFAGLSWWQSRRSANAAEESAQRASELADIEQQRRLTETTPRFAVSGDADMDDLVTFTLTVTGPKESYTVEVEAIEGSYVETIKTDKDASTRTPRIGLGDVRQGVPVVFYGYKQGDSDQHQRFRVHFSDGTNHWPEFAECEITWPPMIY